MTELETGRSDGQVIKLQTSNGSRVERDGVALDLGLYAKRFECRQGFVGGR